jgi:hypothetical protein
MNGNHQKSNEGPNGKVSRRTGSKSKTGRALRKPKGIDTLEIE